MRGWPSQVALHRNTHSHARRSMNIYLQSKTHLSQYVFNISAKAIFCPYARIQGPVTRAKRLFVTQRFGVGLCDLQPEIWVLCIRDQKKHYKLRLINGKFQTLLIVHDIIVPQSASCLEYYVCSVDTPRSSGRLPWDLTSRPNCFMIELITSLI
jgi:hypothetical protein